MRILITGANGQLGHYLQEEALNFSEVELIPCSRQEIDLTDSATIQTALEKYKPEAIINAAAYTAVDQAEEESELAHQINGHAVGELAKACSNINALLIQISTDYVFDGEKGSPYKPEDTPNPLNEYGKSKLLGEKNALKYAKHAIVIRTSWVYSEYGHNFANTMRRLFKEKDEIRVVDDQKGCPTHARNLAKYSLEQALKYDKTSSLKQIQHFTDGQAMTWYQFACQLLSQTNSTTKIIPIPTSQFPTIVERPVNSIMTT